QLSEVIKSSVGYLIVRLNDIKPEQSRAFKEVRTELLKKVQQEKTLDAYYALQQQVSTSAANNNDSLESAAVAADLQTKKTNWFTRRTVPAELNFKPVIQAIFEGSLIGADGASSANSDVINVEGDKAFVIRVDGYTPEKPQSLDQ
ncbi:MAG: peptidylprolyl isomerase, partial [Candidatus Regiella insecticola]|nr:peptidylprolyl isomerase [Candidatus Regiella insecticola]